MRIGIFILLSLLLYSCSKTSETEQYAKLVEQWQGKEIKFPDVMTDLLTGDTIDLSDADFTILTYIDSTGCTGCKMKLPLWKERIYLFDSISENNVMFLMVVHTDNVKDLKILLERDSFEHYVYLDKNDEMNITNGLIADDPLFQTFFIDRSHKVIAVGNPTHNNTTANLYESILSGRMTFSPETNAIVSVSDNHIKFENLNCNESVFKEIIFSNTGNDTVHIRKIIPSCECTELYMPHDYIPPETRITATLKYTGDSIPEEFNSSVNVFYSNFEYPTIIQISGNTISNEN